MRFLARVGTADGRILEEIFSADTEVRAREQLEGRGLHVFELRRRGVRLELPALSLASLRRKSVTDQEFLLFNQELASLLRAGLPLLQTLDLMLERQRNPSFRAILADVRDRVRSGAELSTAFSRYPEFPPLYASTLKAGERSGELEAVIRRFVRYLKLVMETKKRVVSALIYPSVLVTLSIAMLAVMILVVIPKFRVFFEAQDIELPWVTMALLSLSEFLRSRQGLVVVGLLAGVLYAVYRFTRTRVGREWLDGVKLALPLVGGVLHRFSLSEFCRSLGTLLSGGLPLVPSLEVAVGSVGNAYLRSRLVPVVPAVREGRALYQALEDSQVFTDLGIDMVKVGEATGALDEMLTHVSDFFDEEVETKIERMLSLLEPLMLVFMGLSVASLLLAMYLPLFTMLGKIQ